MKHNYRDISSRISEAPKWFDENAVPRYCDFSPRETANIYAKECALMLVECQSCQHPFEVAMSFSTLDAVHGQQPLSENIQALHYGDPPNVACCAAGPTEDSVPKKVLQFWSHEAGKDFVRRPELEVEIKCDWYEE